MDTLHPASASRSVYPIRQSRRQGATLARPQRPASTDSPLTSSAPSSTQSDRTFIVSSGSSSSATSTSTPTISDLFSIRSTPSPQSSISASGSTSSASSLSVAFSSSHSAGAHLTTSTIWLSYPAVATSDAVPTSTPTPFVDFSTASAASSHKTLAILLEILLPLLLVALLAGLWFGCRRRRMKRHDRSRSGEERLWNASKGGSTGTDEDGGGEDFEFEGMRRTRGINGHRIVSSRAPPLPLQADKSEADHCSGGRQESEMESRGTANSPLPMISELSHASTFDPFRGGFPHTSNDSLPPPSSSTPPPLISSTSTASPSRRLTPLSLSLSFLAKARSPLTVISAALGRLSPSSSFRSSTNNSHSRVPSQSDGHGNRNVRRPLIAPDSPERPSVPAVGRDAPDVGDEGGGRPSMSIKTAVTPQTARHDKVSREVSEGMSEVEIVWDESGALGSDGQRRNHKGDGSGS